jgi:hypothetical protein
LISLVTTTAASGIGNSAGLAFGYPICPKEFEDSWDQ